MVALIDGVFVALSQPTAWVWSFIALIAMATSAAFIWRRKPPQRGRWLVAVIGGGFALSVLLAIPYLLSATRKKDPLGSNEVQIATVALASRDAGKYPGLISMRIWYPAAGVAAPSAPLTDCAGLLSLPLASDQNARRLILYMPHLTGPADDNSARLSYLASHGYVVVAFDDIARDPVPAGATSDDKAVRFETGEFRTQQEFNAGVARFDARVKLQAKKALHGLDLLAACAAENPGSPWSGSVDYTHVGFLGFSFGGATAAEASALDDRIAAVVNLDGNLFGQAFAGRLRAPYMFIMSGRSLGTKELMTQQDPLEAFHWRTWSRDLHEEKRLIARPGSLGIRIRDSVHLSLCNVVFEPHASRLWVLKNPIEFYNAANLYTRAFFDTRLRAPKSARAEFDSLDDPAPGRFKFVERLGETSLWPPRQGVDGAPLH